MKIIKIMRNILRVLTIIGLAIAFPFFWTYNAITKPFKRRSALRKIGYAVSRELTVNRQLRRRLKGTGILLTIDKIMAKSL